MQRPPSLAHAKRVVLATGALICYAAAVALSPSDVRSQLNVPSGEALPESRLPIETPPAAITPEGDAFAPRAAIEDDPPRAPAVQPSTAALPALHAAPVVVPRRRPDTRVTAVAVGARPTAVVESGSTSRVVGIGDPLDDSTIDAIDGDGVRLANGHRLLLDPAGTLP